MTLEARGTVLFIQLPAPSPSIQAETSGSEQAFNRPAVVVQALDISGSRTVIVVPGTTRPGAASVQTVVSVKPSSTNGLKELTHFLPFQIRAIDGARVVRQLGKLAPTELRAIDNALRDLLCL